jgi:hypothetical protein
MSVLRHKGGIVPKIEISSEPNRLLPDDRSREKAFGARALVW